MASRRAETAWPARMTSMAGTGDTRHGVDRVQGAFHETIRDPAEDDPGTGRPAFPNLVSDVQTTHAAVPDVVMTAPAHDSLETAGLLQGEHDLDSGYVPADLLVSSRQRGFHAARPRRWPISPPGPRRRARPAGIRH